MIQLADLIYQLTQIILQNSGGDRCALILPSENQVCEVRAIARQIVESTHGGKLSCNSVLGEGTEFMIEIPL
ncbi:hypothetical protein GTQ43_00955 [Nostoc sp. KVJ3]|uniref:hypothetical protein n=1 Tax=Nostoc sp. KVJ3 TaxID=457945 RepID=UPI002238945D|nr:hypothetical protein [Nostoc sp. KVJ3]MCW5312471.1 hypothetical protein [Nostoc sp. KVJ3]